MQKLRTLILSSLMLLGIGLAPVLATTTVYANTKEEICKGSGGTWNGSQCSNSNATSTDLSGFIRRIVNILLFIVGAVSVIMIVVGGLRYTLSGGDSSSVSSAKNTVLYAIVGLVVAFMAYAIINFVLKNL